MKSLRAAIVVGAFALSACGGGQAPVLVPAASLSAAGAGASDVAAHKRKPKPKTGTVHFFIKVPKHNPKRPARIPRGERPNFIPAHSESIEVTLNTVNGDPPPEGLSTSVVTNLTDCATGCTVGGPNSPPGSDNYTLNIFDATNATGNKIATATTTFTVTAGTANVGGPVTMEGIPNTFVLVGSVPTGAGGTAFADAGSLAVNVEDVDGDVISGTYAQIVTVVDSDTASLTLASGLTLTGSGGSCSSPASSQVLNTSSDAANLALCYGGLDIVPAVFSGTTSLVTVPVTIGTFSPTVQPIAYVGPENGSGDPEIDLYVANGPTGGTGSFGTWTDSQAGWTNSPYAQAITETDNCNGGGNAIATFAASGSPSGTSWQSNAVASPAVGTCTITLKGGGGATQAVINTYTTTSIGTNGKHHKAGKPIP